MKVKFDENKFYEMPVIGILRSYSLAQIEEIIPYFIKAGFTNLEVTMNTEGAESIIRELSNRYPTLNIGAGTVCDLKDLKKSLNAGASFIVTPILDKKVVKKCHKWGVPVFPGAFTPREIYLAAKYGATAVKVFPANILGPSYMKDVLAPLNNLKLFPTGGITLENIPAYFKSGASGVGMGGSLFLAKYLDIKDYNHLSLHFEQVAQAVKMALKEK